MRSFEYKTDRALQHDLAHQAFVFSTTTVTPPILCLDLALAESPSRRKRVVELKRVGPPPANDLPEFQQILSQYTNVSGIVSLQTPTVRAILPIPLPRVPPGAWEELKWPMAKWYRMFGSVVSQGSQTPQELRDRMTRMVQGEQLWCNFLRHERSCDCIGALVVVGTLGRPPIGDYSWWWLEYPPFTQWYYDTHGRDPLDRFNELPECDPVIREIRKWLTSEVWVLTTWIKPSHKTYTILLG